MENTKPKQEKKEKEEKSETHPKTEQPSSPSPDAEQPSSPSAKAEQPSSPSADAERPSSPSADAERPSGPSSKAERPSSPSSKAERPSSPSADAERPSGPSPASEAVAEKKEQKGTSSIPPEASSPFLRINGGKIETSLSFEFTKIKHPDFKPGDTLKVHFRIREGEKQRIQVYEGIVISMSGEGSSRSFIVRRISHDVGVERVFPYYSPSIQKIQVVRRGKVRRSRLYYLRNRKGKEARVREAFHRTAAKK